MSFSLDHHLVEFFSFIRAIRSKVGNSPGRNEAFSMTGCAMLRIKIFARCVRPVKGRSYGRQGNQEHMKPHRFFNALLASSLILYIPSSSHNPKLRGNDDAKIVRNSVAERGPISRDLFAQESERRVGEVGASGVAFVVRDVLVHDAP